MWRSLSKDIVCFNEYLLVHFFDRKRKNVKAIYVKEFKLFYATHPDFYPFKL